MASLTKFKLNYNIKIYSYNCSKKYVFFTKSYSYYIVYILFFADINKLMFMQAKFWSIFSISRNSMYTQST